MFELPQSDTPPIKKGLGYGKLVIDIYVYTMLVVVVGVATWYFSAWPEVQTEGEDE